MNYECFYFMFIPFGLAWYVHHGMASTTFTTVCDLCGRFRMKSELFSLSEAVCVDKSDIYCSLKKFFPNHHSYAEHVCQACMNKLTSLDKFIRYSHVGNMCMCVIISVWVLCDDAIVVILILFIFIFCEYLN